MASQFYGMKGNLIKEYQRILNSFGANLKVNGKWNEKTEMAYLKYMDQFNRAIGLTVETPEAEQYEPYNFTPRTEEELRATAENTYGSLYGSEIEAIQRNAQAAENDRLAQIEALEPAYQKKQADLSAQYAQQRQTLSDEALSRGLGRSSYVTDQLSGSQKREMSDSQALMDEKEAKLASLQREIEQLRADASASTSRLLGERERSILSAIDQYRAQDAQTAQDALKYNNQLRQQANQDAQSSYEYGQNQLNEQNRYSNEAWLDQKKKKK